jgi:hypothetical protein
MAMLRSMLRVTLLALLLTAVNAQPTATYAYSQSTGPDFYGAAGSYGSGVPAQSYIKLTGRCAGPLCPHGAGESLPQSRSVRVDLNSGQE